MTRGTAKLADRFVLLLATLCLAGNAYHVPSAATWSSILQDRPYLLPIFLLIVGIFGAFTPFEQWHSRSVADQNVMMRRRILSTFGRVLEIANDIEPPLEMGDLALHVWRKRLGIRHPVSGTLERVASYRMATSPMNRPFSPTKGVGAVGICWQKDKEVRFNAAEPSEMIGSEAEFEKYVAESGHEAVMNLTWQQFQDFKHRTALFAVPIRNGRGRFIGCISVDASRGFEVLNKRVVIEEMSKLSLSIGQDDFQFV
ncbi:hypothetical protein [Amycolatopsis sp. NPDC003861]